MAQKVRLQRLENIVGTRADAAQAAEQGEAIRARLKELLADPAAMEREIQWDVKHLAEESPFKINMDGLSREERGAAIEAAHAADPPDGDFQPWVGGESGGQL